MGTNAEKIQLANITIDSKFQTRGANDEETVAAYAELITAEENPNSWPFNEPVRITIVGDDYYLTDGFHRYAAAKRVGRRYVLASVKVGTYLEAFQDALGANASHGRQRTNQEKNNLVVVALSEPEIAKLSNRAIAKICHVSELLVRKHRPAKSKPQVRFNRSQFGGGNSKPSGNEHKTQSEFNQETPSGLPEIDINADTVGTESHHTDHTVTPNGIDEPTVTPSQTPNGQGLDIAGVMRDTYRKLGVVVRNLERVGTAKGDKPTFERLRNKLNEVVEDAQEWTKTKVN